MKVCQDLTRIPFAQTCSVNWQDSSILKKKTTYISGGRLACPLRVLSGHWGEISVKHTRPTFKENTNNSLHILVIQLYSTVPQTSDRTLQLRQPFHVRVHCVNKQVFWIFEDTESKLNACMVRKKILRRRTFWKKSISFRPLYCVVGLMQNFNFLFCLQ